MHGPAFAFDPAPSPDVSGNKVQRDFAQGMIATKAWRLSCIPG
jgi:hypothetical protein